MTMSKSVTAERTQWANRISAAWQKSVDSIIETGRLLLAAKADPKMQEFDRRASARTFLQARRRRRRSSLCRPPILACPFWKRLGLVRTTSVPDITNRPLF